MRGSGHSRGLFTKAGPCISVTVLATRGRACQPAVQFVRGVGRRAEQQSVQGAGCVALQRSRQGQAAK